MKKISDILIEKDQTTLKRIQEGSIQKKIFLYFFELNFALLTFKKSKIKLLNGKIVSPKFKKHDFKNFVRFREVSALERLESRKIVYSKAGNPLDQYIFPFYPPQLGKGTYLKDQLACINEVFTDQRHFKQQGRRIAIL